MSYQGMFKNSVISKTVFTAICGISLIVVAPFVGNVFSIDSFYLTVSGMFLLGFVMPECMFLFTNSISEHVSKFIILKDIMLITFCFAAMGLNLFALGAPAMAMLGVFGSLFAVNTYMQHYNLTKKIEMDQTEETPKLKVVYIDAA